MDMKREPRIVILSDFYGVVARGAERIVDELWRNLEGNVSILGMAGVFSRTETPAESALQDLDRLISRTLRGRWARFAGGAVRDRFRMVIGTRDYISPSQVLDARFAGGLPNALDRAQPDVVISYGGLHTHRVASGWCRRAGAVLLGHYGGPVGWSMRVSARQLTHGIVVSTPDQLAYVRRHEPKSRAHLIPPGVDLDAFRPVSAPTEVASLAALASPRVLCVSAFDAYKRLDLLVDAVARLGVGSLALVGDGALRDAVVSHAMKTLGPGRFVYLGTLNKTDLASVYRGCDVFCLPSQNEAFGIVIIEAMASNKPVVVTQDAVRAWMVGDAGITVDVEDQARFGAALSHAAAADWANRPRSRAAFFSSVQVARAWNDLIASCLEGRTDRPTLFERDSVSQQKAI